MRGKFVDHGFYRRLIIPKPNFSQHKIYENMGVHWPYSPAEGQNHKFCPYTEEYRLAKNRILAYFMQCMSFFKYIGRFLFRWNKIHENNLKINTGVANWSWLWIGNLIELLHCVLHFWTKYSRMGQVKFVEKSLSNIWSDMVCLMVCPLLNILTHF